MKHAATKQRSSMIACCILSAAIVTGCESTNQFIFEFNQALDAAVLKPVADTYVAVTPEPVRDGLHNAFDNLGYFNTILNDFLQGKGKQGASDLGRMAVNSTLGVAGIFDVATGMGMERHEEDFGQTLGVWGAGPGPYFVLPVFGPSTLRDAPGLGVAYAANPIVYLNPDLRVTFPLGAVSAADKRAHAQKSIENRDEAAVDSYEYTKQAYLDHREFLIYDGDPPLPELPQLEDEYEDDAPGVDSPSDQTDQSADQSNTP